MPEKVDDPSVIEIGIGDLADLLLESKCTVVYTGAGVSTAAGVPDFRGPKGVWTMEEKGIPTEFNISFEEAIPTYTHMALVILENRGLVHYLVSQNVDGLHIRSGFPKDRLAELHGNMFIQTCDKCKREYVLDTVSPTVGMKLTGMKCQGMKPRGKCRGSLKDSILDWDDALPVKHLQNAEIMSRASTLSITLGTSLQILPAANLPLLTKKNNGKLVIVNLQVTKHDKKADLRIYGYTDKIMKGVMEKLNIEVPGFVRPLVCEKSKNPNSILLTKTNRPKRKTDNKEGPGVKKKPQETYVPQSTNILADDTEQTVKSES